MMEVVCFSYQLTGVGSRDAYASNKLAKLGDAIAISNLKLSITDPLTHSLTH